MKTIVLAALGAALLAGVATTAASAAERHHARATRQAPVLIDNGGFRNSYAYSRGFDGPAYDARVVGGAMAAPAGR